MPANNRVHSSAALQTHGIWQSAIGYDPYAPNKEDNKKSSTAQPQSSNPEPEGENAYASFQGLLALARITGSNADEARGSCKKCGRVGHLTFQCRNFLSIKEDKDKDPEAIQAAVMSGLEKLKGKRKEDESSDESDEDESESSDSDYDSEIERAIAKKYGKSLFGKSKKTKDDDDDDDDESDDDERRKRGRSKKKSAKRSVSDSDDDKKRKKEKKRRKDDVSDEDRERRSEKRKSRREKRRRRSHRHSDDRSDSSEEESSRRRKRSSKKKSKSKRKDSSSDSDGSGFEDSRVGRDKKRSDRRNRK